jgi:hypothetical protein
VTSGPISETGRGRPDLDLREALLDRADELVAPLADRDDDRDRHAALAGEP